MNSTHNPDQDSQQTYQLYDRVQVLTGENQGTTWHIIEFFLDGSIGLYSPFTKAVSTVASNQDIQPC